MTNPAELDVPIEIRSLKHLQRYLEEHPGMGRLCRDTIRRNLHANRISWQQAQYQQESRDPDFDSKKLAVEARYIESRLKPLSYIWTRKSWYSSNSRAVVIIGQRIN